MPRILIDQREIDAPPGATILDAAELLGIEIPTLCFSRQCEPSTSCLVCLVKLLPGGRMVPACATPVSEGMQVESETDEIHAVRAAARWSCSSATTWAIAWPRARSAARRR